MNYIKITCVLWFSLLFKCSSLAQSIEEVFNSEIPLTWLGLDFTGAKFIGDQDSFGSVEDMVEKIEAWNVLMENEYEKYNIGEAFYKKTIYKAFEITKAHNSTLDISDKLISQINGHRLLESDIQEIVKSYDNLGTEAGMALMLIIESFDKTNTKSVMHFTFLDLQSRQVILTRKIVGTPVGFGLRNYWAGSIYYSLKAIRKREYKTWKKRYVGKN
ncbi:MAG: hypothetical protein RIB47_14960 [Cyclobacteriaceae bacterium]